MLLPSCYGRTNAQDKNKITQCLCFHSSIVDNTMLSSLSMNVKYNIIPFTK